MPNVTLLIPIADVLGITVTELLKGEKLREEKTLNSDEVENLVVNSLDLSLLLCYSGISCYYCSLFRRTYLLRYSAL